MRLTASLLAFGVLAAAPQIAAADTLEDAIAHALAHDPELASLRANVDEAAAARQAAFANFLPSFNATVNRATSWSNIPTLDPDTNAVRPAGSTESGSANVEVSQTIFSSGRLLTAYAAARADEERAKAIYRAQEDQLIMLVVQAYAGVLYGEQAVKIEQDDVSRLGQEVDAANVRFEAGVATKTDVYQAQTALAAARSSLAAAQADLAAQRATYYRRVGELPGTLAPPALPALPANVEAAIADARAHAPQIAAARLGLKAAKQRTRNAYADYFPSLTLAGAAQRSGENGFEGFHNDSTAASLRLSIPLWTGGRTTATVREARAAERGAEYALDDSYRASDETVAQDWARLDAARLQADATAAQFEAATLAAKGAELERREGLRTQLDLLEQIANQNAAALAVAAAKRDLLMGAYAVLEATGALPRPHLGKGGK